MKPFGMIFPYVVPMCVHFVTNPVLQDNLVLVT